MSDADKLKDRLLTDFLNLRRKAANERYVDMAFTGEHNRIAVAAQDNLGIDMHDLMIKERERERAFFRHADDPISRRPLTVDEMNRTVMDGDKFRAKLDAAINRLNGFVPPRDPIGFRR